MTPDTLRVTAKRKTRVSVWCLPLLRQQSETMGIFRRTSGSGTDAVLTHAKELSGLQNQTSQTPRETRWTLDNFPHLGPEQTSTSLLRILPFVFICQSVHRHGNRKEFKHSSSLDQPAASNQNAAKLSESICSKSETDFYFLSPESNPVFVDFSWLESKLLLPETGLNVASVFGLASGPRLSWKDLDSGPALRHSGLFPVRNLKRHLR